MTGRIQTRNYENQQGQRVYVTEVVAENFQLLESRTASEQRQQNPSSGDSFQGGGNNFNNNYNQSSRSAKNTMPDFDRDSDPFSGSSIDISDDDLPF